MISSKNYKIHTAGILQWQAYRILEDELDSALLSHKLTAPEWKTLGIIFDAQAEGIRSLQIAHKLGVKPPLVTRILDTLEAKKLISVRTLKEDRRVRIAQHTKKGEGIFTAASQSVDFSMKKILWGVDEKDMKGYKKVLLKIVENKK